MGICVSVENESERPINKGEAFDIRFDREAKVNEMWNYASDNGENIVKMKEFGKVLKKINFPAPKKKDRTILFERYARTHKTHITEAEFHHFFDQNQSLPDLSSVFKEINKGREIISFEKVRGFMEDIQCRTFNHEDYNRFFKSYKIDMDDTGSPPVLTLIGFTKGLFEQSNSIMNPKHREPFQDMTRPLTHYFIDSSHNSYLSGNQLSSLCSVKPIARALKLGCRVIELDCYDGENCAPIVYHGGTLTKHIKFKHALEAISEDAFSASIYPVIVTLENHCSPEQQVIQAKLIREIFGDNLYIPPHDPPENYLSPSELTFKVIIRDKFKTHMRVPELLELIYLRNVKCKKPQNMNKLTHSSSVSWSETRLSGNLRDPALVRQFASQHVVRVYPSPKRVNSSNYNPVPAWYSGCQMVALNYQAKGKPIFINHGFFQNNGGCGYVLKPDSYINLEPYVPPSPKAKRKKSLLKTPSRPMSTDSTQKPKAPLFLSLFSSPSSNARSMKRAQSFSTGFTNYPPMMSIKDDDNNNNNNKNGTPTSKNHNGIPASPVRSDRLISPTPVVLKSSATVPKVLVSPISKPQSVPGNSPRLQKFEPRKTSGTTSNMVSNAHSVSLSQFPVGNIFGNNSPMDCSPATTPHSVVNKSCNGNNNNNNNSNNNGAAALTPLHVRLPSEMKIKLTKPKVILTLEIISAHYLPTASESNASDKDQNKNKNKSNGNILSPYVSVEILGSPADFKRVRTHTQRNNGYNPQFHRTFEFQIFEPEFCMVLFQVYDQNNNRIGHFCIHYENIACGYRFVPLRNKKLHFIPHAHLFCFAKKHVIKEEETAPVFPPNENKPLLMSYFRNLEEVPPTPPTRTRGSLISHSNSTSSQGSARPCLDIETTNNVSNTSSTVASGLTTENNSKEDDLEPQTAPTLLLPSSTLDIIDKTESHYMSLSPSMVTEDGTSSINNGPTTTTATANNKEGLTVNTTGMMVKPSTIVGPSPPPTPHNNFTPLPAVLNVSINNIPDQSGNGNNNNSDNNENSAKRSATPTEESVVYVRPEDISVSLHMLPTVDSKNGQQQQQQQQQNNEDNKNQTSEFAKENGSTHSRSVSSPSTLKTHTISYNNDSDENNYKHNDEQLKSDDGDDDDYGQEESKTPEIEDKLSNQTPQTKKRTLVDADTQTLPIKFTSSDDEGIHVCADPK